MSFLPSPLHPLIVHMPIALTILVPLFAFGALVMIKRGARPQRAWGLAVAMLAALWVSGWVALQTGEREEEKVERVVAEGAIHTHEEAAELFLMTAGVVLVLAAAGFLKGRPGSVMRGVAAVGTVALIGAGYNVGTSGGKLVYREGAASAYATAAGAQGGEERAGQQGREQNGREREDDDQ